MNFHITRHTPIRKKKRKVTKETGNEGLASWAEHSECGATMDVKPDAVEYDALRRLKGHIRIAGRWKAFVTVHPDRVNILHCGAAPSLKEEITS